MKKMLRLVLVVCAVAFAPLAAVTTASASSGAAQVVVTEVKVEPVKDTDGEYTWFTVSCAVDNQTEVSGTVSVVIRTVDHWAYEKKPLKITGSVKAGEKTRISVLDFMDSRTFKSLKRFEVASVELH